MFAAHGHEKGQRSRQDSRKHDCPANTSVKASTTGEILIMKLMCDVSYVQFAMRECHKLKSDGNNRDQG